MFRHGAPKKVNTSPTADLEAVLDGELKNLKMIEKGLGEAARVWAETMPADLSPTFLRITSHKTLEIAVPDESSRYIAELHLRSGALSKFLTACAARRVRILVRGASR